MSVDRSNVRRRVGSVGSVLVNNPLVAAAGSSADGSKAARPPPRRRRTIGDVGFATFTASMNMGWYAEISSRKFRQVRLSRRD